MGSATEAGDDAEPPVSFNLNIVDGRTEIRVSGDRDTAVIVRSNGNEHVYLPPEDFEREPERQTPYRSEPGTGQQTPYRSDHDRTATPYRSQPDMSGIEGMESTADGYVVVHPEPVTDVRFLR